MNSCDDATIVVPFFHPKTNKIIPFKNRFGIEISWVLNLLMEPDQNVMIRQDCCWMMKQWERCTKMHEEKVDEWDDDGVGN